MAEANKKSDVVLVWPPVAPANAPAFGLSILKAALTEAGISCTVDYAAFHYINAIGEDYYKVDWQTMDDFFMEYLLAKPAGVEIPYTFQEVFEHHIEIMHPSNRFYDKRNEEKTRQELWEAAKRVQAIGAEEIEKTVERILALEPKIVGCAAIMSQVNASLAILKRIKELRPDITTIIGGFHAFDESGLALIKKYHYIDYVFAGESDDMIAPFCESILKGEEPKLVYGLLKQGGPYPEEPPHRVLVDMDKAYVPDYSDYIEFMESDNGPQYIKNIVHKEMDYKEFTDWLFESSRGCWWGAKTACTFCGLNGALRNHRRKAPELFLKQLEEFVERYQLKVVCLCDTLLPEGYMEEVVPKLKEKHPAELWIELRATMRACEIDDLVKAGYTKLVFGIESFSNHLLKLMHKGTSVLNNVASIKYARKNKCKLNYNILSGFPGENVADYEEQTALFPLIEHLVSPQGSGSIFFVRNNYYVTHPEEYGLKFTPSLGMRMMYPADEEYLAAMATVFDVVDAKPDTPAMQEAKKAYYEGLQAWRKQDKIEKCYLEMARKSYGWLVFDTRSCRTVYRQKVEGLEAVLLELCEEPTGFRLLVKQLQAEHAEVDIKTALASLLEKKLMLKDGEMYLALPVELSLSDYMTKYLLHQPVVDHGRL